MKVYIVESLECDWDTHSFIEGTFSSIEKAVEHVKSIYSHLREYNPILGTHIAPVVKHFYGYNIKGGIIYTEDDGTVFHEYEEDGYTYTDYNINQYSISVTEWELDK